jgi:hypothetical protein
MEHATVQIYKYIYYGTTNLGNKKNINIYVDAPTSGEAKYKLADKILQLLKKGIPVFVYDVRIPENQYLISMSEPIFNTYNEWVEVDSNFLMFIYQNEPNLILPNILKLTVNTNYKKNENMQKTLNKLVHATQNSNKQRENTKSKLNINAPEFIPKKHYVSN